jgi:hypothetical protein
MAWNLRANEVFLQAVEAPAGPARTALLDSACGGDAELRRQVEVLLKAHDDAGSFLDHPPLGAETPGDATVTRPGGPGAEDAGHDLGFLDPPRREGSVGRLKNYEVRSVVGSGGMGVVMKAVDESLDRVVAIKVLSPHYAANATARKRFVREAKAIAAVTHEHVVTVHAVGEESEPVPYLVMQFIQGQSLQERLDRGGPLELKEVLRIGMQIAQGLAAAHAQGIVHRDIKPANILLENGIERVKLTDFGLARMVDDASVTQSGVIAGTPLFMSPEQAAGEPVDARGDLFSLGSVLYMMCTGHAPFRASGTMAVMKRVIEDTPRPVREVNPEIPDWLDAIIAQLHAKKPADRLQSATEVADLLEQHLKHLQQPNIVPMPAPLRRPPAAQPSGTSGHALLGPALLMIMPLLLIPIVLIGGSLLDLPGLKLLLILTILGSAGLTLTGVVLFRVRLAARLADPRPHARHTLARRRWVLLAVPSLLLVVFLGLWLTFRTTFDLYGADAGQLVVIPKSDFEQFRIKTFGTIIDSGVGSDSREWTVNGGEVLVLPPGDYRVSAVVPISRRVHGWTVEASRGVSGYRAHFEGGECRVEVRRGEQVRIEVTGWTDIPATAKPDQDREELERLVKLQEQEVARAKERYKAGVAARGDVVAAEIQLLEVRNRLAIAEEKSVVPALKEIVAKTEEMRDVVKQLFNAGKVSATEMTAAEKAVSEARIRLREAEARSK